MAAHSSNSWAGLRHGNGNDVGHTRATIPLTGKDQPKPIFWRLLNTNYHEHKHSKPITGTIEKITCAKVVSEVVIRTADGSVTSIITAGSVQRMESQRGRYRFCDY
jgi:hypothetical protein